MKKIWLILIAAAVLTVIVAWSVARPDAVVEVILPAVQTVRAYVEEQAVTELPHDHLVAMPIAGWLEPIRLREGDNVEKDQVVARLETHDLKDRVTQAEQRIAVLESQIAETSDHRLEQNALVEINATVKAVDETVKASEAKLDAARAMLEFTRTEVERLDKLSETGSAGERELRGARLEFRRAEAGYRSDSLELAALKTLAAVSYVGPKFIHDYIDRKSFTLDQHNKDLVEARTQLEIERRNHARAEVRCPIDGVVLIRHQTRRQYLAAGTPLLTVGRLDEMEVVAEVLTERAAHVSQGDLVEIYGRGLPDGPIEGTVARVHPAGFRKISSLGVEQQRVKVSVKPSLRPDRLGVGFRVYVRLFYDEAADALTVPRTCLIRTPDGAWSVMIVRDGVIEARTVTVGIMNDDIVHVAAGISATDLVIARPSREITVGMRVEIVGP